MFRYGWAKAICFCWMSPKLDNESAEFKWIKHLSSKPGHVRMLDLSIITVVNDNSLSLGLLSHPTYWDLRCSMPHQFPGLFFPIPLTHVMDPSGCGTCFFPLRPCFISWKTDSPQVESWAAAWKAPWQFFYWTKWSVVLGTNSVVKDNVMREREWHAHKSQFIGQAFDKHVGKQKVRE